MRRKIPDNWEQKKKDLQTRFNELTNEDLDFRDGNYDQLVGRISKRISKTREQVEQILDRV